MRVNERKLMVLLYAASLLLVPGSWLVGNGLKKFLEQ